MWIPTVDNSVWSEVAAELKRQMVVFLPVMFVAAVVVTVFLGLPARREICASTAAFAAFMLGVLAFFAFAMPYVPQWFLLVGFFLPLPFSGFVYRAVDRQISRGRSRI